MDIHRYGEASVPRCLDVTLWSQVLPVGGMARTVPRSPLWERHLALPQLSAVELVEPGGIAGAPRQRSRRQEKSRRELSDLRPPRLRSHVDRDKRRG